MQQNKIVTTKQKNPSRHFRYRLLLEGIAVGAAAGLVTVLFRLALEQADLFRQQISTFISAHSWAFFLWLPILLGLAYLTVLLLRIEPYISGSGIPQVKGEILGGLSQKWWRVLTAKFAGGLLTIGAGLSLGREGPSIQIGAMAGKGISQLLHRGQTEEKMLLTCGASAGLSAAFNAPFAGILFSLEELHKTFSTDILLSATSASITAGFVSRCVFGLKPVFNFTATQMLPLHNYWMVLVLGVILGLVGALYNFCIKKSQYLYDKIRSPFIRLAIPFLLAGILLIVYPMVLGGGHNLIGLVSQDTLLQTLLLLFIIKFIFSMISFGSGAPGGIFLPLLVLGAICGSFFSQILTLCGVANPLQNFVILGMAGLFAAIVRAPVTGVILICEMTGSFSHLLTLSIVSLTAYAIADLLHAKPVYDILLQRLMRKQSPAPHSKGKILIESPVCCGAPVCGKTIQEVSWPEQSHILSVKRYEQELIPKGKTVLKPGDILLLLCDEAESSAVQDYLEKQCKNPSETT